MCSMNCLRRLFRCSTQDPPDEIGNVDTKPTDKAGSPGEIGKDEHDYSKYGLPPELATKNLKRDGFRKYTTERNLGKDKSKVLYFLYGRGFYINSSKKERVKKVMSILDDEKALKRAVRLLTHDGDRDVTAELEEVYKTLCKTLEAYFAQEGAFGIKVPTVDDVLLNYFRFQKQGNCFLLAPCVFISYLMQHKGINDQGPLDLTQYVRHSFDDKKLHSYLARDVGGDTVSELNSILQSLSSAEYEEKFLESPCINTLKDRKSDFALERRLELAGPGIVSNFTVQKGFKNSRHNLRRVGYMKFAETNCFKKGNFIEFENRAQTKYEVTLAQYLETHVRPTTLESAFDAAGNEDECNVRNEEKKNANEDSAQDGKGENLETHAMVLIGGRHKNRKLFFLLQNWWTDMQLVEVSAEYLGRCGAQIHFAKKTFEFAPQNERQSYSLNESLLADANYFDRAEQKSGGLSPPTLDRASRCTAEP